MLKKITDAEIKLVTYPEEEKIISGSLIVQDDKLFDSVKFQDDRNDRLLEAVKSQRQKNKVESKIRGKLSQLGKKWQTKLKKSLGISANRISSTGARVLKKMPSLDFVDSDLPVTTSKLSDSARSFTEVTFIRQCQVMGSFSKYFAKEENCLKEGLFRVSGDARVIKILKEKCSNYINSKNKVGSKSGFDFFDESNKLKYPISSFEMTGVLKKFIRDCDLISDKDAYYKNFMKLGEDEAEDFDLSKDKETLIRGMGSNKAYLFGQFLSILKQVASFVDSNGMNPKNLAICVAPIFAGNSYEEVGKGVKAMAYLIQNQ